MSTESSAPARKTSEQLRSARWFATDDLRGFGHRSRFMQMGYGSDDWVGRPMVAILNAWSDINLCPPGAVLVMDSRKDARAASAGGILVTRLQMRGVAGVVTDGGFRDSAEIAGLTIPAFHQRPSAPTNLTLHQAIDINVPVGCGDAPVFPGDVMLGDADGVIVIPAHLADEIAAEATDMTAYEDFVTEQVRDGRSILGLYPATDPQTPIDFAAWRERHGR